MIYGHDHLPATFINIPGPPAMAIESLGLDHIQRWIEEQETHGIVLTTAAIAGERRRRAYGFGSQRWDPTMTRQMPPGWIFHVDERTHVRLDLLRDINDLVAVYNNMTGSACVFIATHPEHDPKVVPSDISGMRLRHNTVIIPGDNVSPYRHAIIVLAETFVCDVALPWTSNWKKRVVEVRYHTRVESTELAASPVNKLDKGYKPHAPRSGSATIISTTTPNAIENPSMIPDSLFDAWLKLKLDTAVDQQPARHKCLTVPATLFNMVDSVHFPGGRDTMKWAQWLMDTAFAVPPAHLVSSIEEKAGIKKPLAKVLASNALEAIARDL